MNPLTMYEVSVLAQYIKSMYEVLAPSRAPSGSSSQPPTDDMEELVFQIIRDMTQGNTTPHLSKTTRCLSTKGATEIVKEARSCNAKELQASDDMEIALITGISLCIRLRI
eukprot:358227_1